MSLDVLFINPGNHRSVYQGLSDDYSAIEPPTWALLLAESVRSVGFSPGILDVNAEQMTISDAAPEVLTLAPRLICFVVYGQNPNSGTVNMAGAVELSEELKRIGNSIPICFVGSHVSALPLKVLEEESSIDIVLCNEGVYALRALLSIDIHDRDSLVNVRGIGFRINGNPSLTEPGSIVPQNRMDVDLPGYAWDLLPYKQKPLDLYRAHFWHAGYDHNKRTPFAAIYTSLGCAFRCNFCMINILNRSDNNSIGVAGDYNTMRFWSVEFVVKEIEKLMEYGVETLRISDEMFLLNKKYFKPLCTALRDKGYGKRLRMWAYSRVDTIGDDSTLQLVRDAGVLWLALGIESGNRSIRLEVSKGKFKDIDIREVIKKIESAGIAVIGNYLFGLPGDNQKTMQETLDLSLELCTLAWNGYPVMALPGSELYKTALDSGVPLPDSYLGYSFLGYDTVPLPTEHLTPGQVLEFRDRAYMAYHSSDKFLAKVSERLGDTAVHNIKNMTKVRLRRRLLEVN